MSQCDSASKEKVCHEGHDRTMTYVPKSTNNPSTSQQEHDAGESDTHMEEVTAEEEKVMPLKCESDQKDARAKPR